MRFTIGEDGVITKLEVSGGCDGNLKGLARLVEGMPAEQVIQKLEGLRCEEKQTSCPGQLAEGLKEVIHGLF